MDELLSDSNSLTEDAVVSLESLVFTNVLIMSCMDELLSGRDVVPVDSGMPLEFSVVFTSDGGAVTVDVVVRLKSSVAINVGTTSCMGELLSDGDP